jgi:hypothetical protein
MLGRNVQTFRIRLEEDRDGRKQQQPRQNDQDPGDQPSQVDGHVVEDVNDPLREQIIGVIADMLNRVRFLLGQSAREGKAPFERVMAADKEVPM